MITLTLLGLTVVLALLAAYVGLVLVRQTRTAKRTAGEEPRTVGDLVRLRAEPAEPADLTGDELFAAPAKTADAPQVAPRPAGAAVPPTPPGGVEAGDAPWRRAARMMGTEPGGRWETAPLPVVPEPVVPVVAETPAAPEESPARPMPAMAPPAREPEPAQEPPAPRQSAADRAATVWAAADAPSRPLSDPDLTPLIGIPIIRPVADDVPPPEPVPVRPSPSDDDDAVVLTIPGVDRRPAPPAATGSPQPVWFRVVRRDGEPVAAAVVTLLDDHGHESDATKTATDGGGELHAPGAGRFMMIAGADGFQPRAAILTVEQQPVEIALQLPRSARVVGAVRLAGDPLVGVRVIAHQEGEVVDESVTDREGGFRFDDLAEGGYALSAAHARGSVVHRVTLAEGVELAVDLDLAPPAG